jgi:hypothetical protein
VKAVALLSILLAVTTCADDLPFLRGMGWSPWHATHGWGRPADVVAQDYASLADLHVNALRTWGPTRKANLEQQFREHGLYLVPQVGGVKAPHMTFADGKTGHVAYAHPESLQAMAERARDLATELAGAEGLAALNLGNEYSWVGGNKTGQYQYQGFDEPTLAAYRASLGKRFGDIATWNRLTGSNDTSFAVVVPPTGQSNSLAFWEWWRFQRQAFGEYLKAGHDALRAAAPNTPVTYALLCGNRWDPATEDADLPFLELQGDNLYYHWDKDWVKYGIRLSRRIGPGRPALVTETGINTDRYPDPDEADRLMRQMLWTLLLHSEVKGVFPFVFCDEWWHGKDKKAPDTREDYWGVLTADRKPKSTYRAVKETYAEWLRLDDIIGQRESEIEVLVSDQAIDRWRGLDTPSVTDVCRALYTHGISFRLVSVLRPSDFAATSCKRLILLDSNLPDNPDGTRPAHDAIRQFSRKGGQILYLGEKPFQALYGKAGIDGVEPTIARVKEPATIWSSIADFLPKHDLQVRAEGEVCWREFRAGNRRFVLLVATDKAIPTQVRLTGAPALSLVSTDAPSVSSTADGWDLAALPSYAIFEVKAD